MELLKIISIVFLTLSVLSASIVMTDILSGHPQKMAIMAWVWPITALWAGPFGLWAYYAVGRGERKSKQLWVTAAIGDLHCAAGCTLGDFAGEWVVFLSAFTIGGSVLWSDYLMDFVLAYIVGIIFQYFAIAPMRHISGVPGIIAAIKADTISLVSFEVGMFAWMALTHEVLFKPPLRPTEPAYWFMMQIAMGVGFLTAWPANSWLIRRGIKEAM